MLTKIKNKSYPPTCSLLLQPKSTQAKSSISNFKELIFTEVIENSTDNKLLYDHRINNLRIDGHSVIHLEDCDFFDESYQFLICMNDMPHFYNFCKDAILDKYSTLHREHNFVLKLSSTLDILRKRRLVQINFEIQNEHEICQKNILELQWHVSNLVRELNNAKEKLNLKYLEHLRLTKSEEYININYPLVQEKVNLIKYTLFSSLS